MTPSEYSELVAFLASKFDAIDRQFEAVNGRLTRVEVGHEESRHQIQLLAEGITALRSEMGMEFDAVRSEMGTEFAAVRSEMGLEFAAVRTEMGMGFAAVRSEMAEGFDGVRSELGTFRKETANGFEGQARLIRGLSARMGRWEGHQA